MGRGRERRGAGEASCRGDYGLHTSILSSFLFSHRQDMFTTVANLAPKSQWLISPAKDYFSLWFGLTVRIYFGIWHALVTYLFFHKLHGVEEENPGLEFERR